LFSASLVSVAQDETVVEIISNVDFAHIVGEVVAEVWIRNGTAIAGADVEVRAVLDTDGKLAGFFVRPWQD
jgi:predicted proteasome-type protease